MKFILASANQHKAEELNVLLSAGNLEILPASEKVEVVEDGSTFQENALKKAKEYFDKFGHPTVADDSGLVLPAKPDILGIHSARYAPEYLDYKDKNNFLINEIKNLTGSDRDAYFICYLCFYISEEEVYFFEGRVHGVIADTQSGVDGFGYDPIFIPDGCDGKSMAEVSEWKMTNSHRAKACLSANKFFKEQR
ncbi:MAG: XTP/dITP diphosphohydrolase [Bacteriovoracaceae bacterium]|jgi:XTP/dITP diphosphohydrolase